MKDVLKIFFVVYFLCISSAFAEDKFADVKSVEQKDLNVQIQNQDFQNQDIQNQELSQTKEYHESFVSRVVKMIKLWLFWDYVYKPNWMDKLITSYEDKPPINTEIIIAEASKQQLKKEKEEQEDTKKDFADASIVGTILSSDNDISAPIQNDTKTENKNFADQDIKADKDTSISQNLIDQQNTDPKIEQVNSETKVFNPTISDLNLADLDIKLSEAFQFEDDKIFKTIKKQEVYRDVTQSNSDMLLNEADSDIKISTTLGGKKEETFENIGKDLKRQQDLEKFTTDEIAVLSIPSDDIVLGELSLSGKLIHVNDTQYIQIFWDNFYRKHLDSKTVRKFITAVRKKPYTFSLDEAKENAIDSAVKNDIFGLRAVINHSKVYLPTYVDKDFNLLKTSVEAEAYDSTYYLIMRGANNSPHMENYIEPDNTRTSDSVIWLLNKIGS